MKDEASAMEGKKYLAKPDFITREIAGDVVLVPVGESAQHFNGMILLNETGQFIWEYIREAHTMEEVVHAMTEEFEVDEDVAAQDAWEFLMTGVVNQLILEVLD